MLRIPTPYRSGASPIAPSLRPPEATPAPPKPTPAPTGLRRTTPPFVLSAAALCLIAASTPATPLGIGDRLFPNLGNPGYDVTSYDLDFTYQGANDVPLTAITTITATTTEPLDRVNLDQARGTVRSVEVNGTPATFRSADEDLVVTPAEPLPAHAPLRITVRHLSDPVTSEDAQSGWVQTSDGLVMANQADGAHRVFPCNDHPSDKAYFTIRVTAPQGYTAVANGLRLSEERRGAATTWVYRTAHPMATELAQVSIGRSTVVRRTGPRGLPVRDVVPTKDRAALEKWLRKTPDQIRWMEKKVGRYPFETYGTLIAEARTGFELETQTLSLFERDLFLRTEIPDWYIESIMVHELAHQWFGDSVSPGTWSDLWLNEGHATWYEALYAEERGERKLADRMRAAYEKSDSWRATGGPPAAPEPPRPGRKLDIFRPVVYDGSALVLYALREEIGRPAFELLERAWVTTHRDATATTDDFVRLASSIAGRDLHDFFHAWLYDARTPLMPAHPDWRTSAVAPADQPGPAPTAAPAPTR